MKIIKGEDINYTVDKLEGQSDAWIGYLLSSVGLFLVFICLFQVINIYLKIRIFSIDVIAGIGGVLVGILFLCLGIIRIVSKKRVKEHILFIKRYGKKSKGQIKQGYDITVNSSPNENYFYPYYYLKVSYFNEDTNSEETFITPKIYGNISKISSDKLDVYYYNGQAIIDNLVLGNKTIKFREGIIKGEPDPDIK